MPIKNSNLKDEGLEELPRTSWLYKYLEYTDGQESPTAFHIWSALSAMGAVLGRKVWIYRGYFLVYPNQYIIIVAESARCRKSTSADIAIDDLLTGYGEANIIREKMTAEFLCKELSQKDKLNNEVCIYAPELATFLGANAFHSGLIPLLTSLYNCPSVRDYKTKESGIFSMSNVCLNILGCTTLDWMSSNMPGDTIEGGFTGRVIFVVKEDPRLREPWPELNPKQVELRSQLIADLHRMGNLYGEYKPTPEAREVYSEWYEKTNEPADLRLRPYEGRKGDHVLKLAMILASSEVTNVGSLSIEDRHIRTALRILAKAEKLMHLAFRGSGYSKSSKDIDRVLRQLEKLAGDNPDRLIPHSILLKKNAHYLNKKEFKDVIDSLEDMQSISIIKQGRGTFYQIRRV